MSILHYCNIQCTAVLYSDWSLQMGQMGPKMALGTLMGMTFQAFRGPSGAQIAITISLATSIGDKMHYHDTVYCS